MKLLILCVDRDNDLGLKAGIESPVIGREECLRAATALGLADPEETDTNSILSGVSLYDDYKANGVDVEVAVIGGDVDVGIKSDQILAKQIDVVLNLVEPKSAILVSDGAEDEYIYPLLGSRIEIDGIKRVVLKQSKNIESIYFMILRSLKEEKVRRKFILPIALALIVFSFISLIQVFVGLPDISWPVVFLTLGIYIIIKAYNLDEPIKTMSQDAKTALSTIPFVLLAGVIIVAGVLAAWNSFPTEDVDETGDPIPITFPDYLPVIGILLWAGVFALILLGMGRSLQIYMKSGDFPWKFFPLVFFVLAFGSIVYGALELTRYLLDEGVTTNILDDIFIFWTIGAFFAVLSIIIFSGIRKQEKTADWHQ